MSQFLFNCSFRTCSIGQIYLKAFQRSRCIENPVKFLKLVFKLAFSTKLVNDFLAVNYFRERTSSQKLDWVLNTPLILSSNVIWHAYRLMAETKIFRLGLSLICLLHDKEESIGKKNYYRKHITSNTEHFQAYLQ